VILLNENLIPLDQRTKDEQREIAQMGGIASAEARRRRKALKETMNLLLEMPATDKRKLAKAVKIGFPDGEVDNSTLVVISLFEKAVGGDIPAIKELRSLIDEGGADNGKLEELLKGIVNANI